MHTHTHKHLIYCILFIFESINPLLINLLDYQVLHTDVEEKWALTLRSDEESIVGYFCAAHFTPKQPW
jgi:hypothetical protein